LRTSAGDAQAPAPLRPLPPTFRAPHTHTRAQTTEAAHTVANKTTEAAKAVQDSANAAVSSVSVWVLRGGAC